MGQPKSGTSYAGPSSSGTAALNAVLPQVQQYLSPSTNPYTPVMLQTAEQNASQAQAAGQYSAAYGAANTGLGTYSEAMPLIQGAAQPLTQAEINQYFNPYVNQVVGATEQQFNLQNAQQQNQVVGNEVSQNALGGNRTAVAGALTAGQQATAEDPIIAGMLQAGYTQQEAMAAQQYQQIPLAAASALQQIGSGQEAAAGNIANLALGQYGLGTQQQQYNTGLPAGTLGASSAQDLALYQEQLARYGYPIQLTNMAAGDISGLSGAYGSNTTTTPPPPSPFSIASGVGTAGIGAAMLLSDRRLKEGIKVIGKTKDGQTIYRFRFKGHPQWHIGLMAQDVEKRHPEAVGRIGGYKAVDVKKATEAAARFVGGRVRGLQTGGVPAMPYGASPTSGLGPIPYAGGGSYIPQVGAANIARLPAAAPMAQPQDDSSNMFMNALKLSEIGSKGSSSPGLLTNTSLGDTIGDTMQDWTAGADAFPAGTPGATGGRVPRAYGGLALPTSNRINVPMRGGLGMPSSMVMRRDAGGSADMSDTSTSAGTDVPPLNPMMANITYGLYGEAAPYGGQGMAAGGTPDDFNDADIAAAAAEPSPAPAPVSGVATDALPSEITAGVGTPKRTPTWRTAADEWAKAGMPANGVAGVLANVKDESNFDSTLRHPDQPHWGGEAHYAHGLYQEGGQEWNNYANWLKNTHPGANWQDPKLQSEFTAQNLKANYPQVWDRMANAKTKEEAAQAFVSGYLKPAAHFENARRSQYAQGVPGVEDYENGTALAFDGTPAPQKGVGTTSPDAGGIPGVTPIKAPDISGKTGANKTDIALSIMAAGLGMMGSRSPYAGVGIGQGGLQGIGTYEALHKQRVGEAERQAQLEQQANIQNVHTGLAAAGQRETHDYHQAEIQHQKDVLQQQKDEAQKRRDELLQAKGYRTTNGGMEIIPGGPADPKVLEQESTRQLTEKGYRRTQDGNLEAIKGGPADPDVITKQSIAKLAGGLMDDDDVDVAARRDIKGDTSWSKNIGRGAQAGQNLIKVQAAENKILREEYGYSPQQAADYIAEQRQAYHAEGIGMGAGARAEATREANLGIILRATDAAIPAALEQSEKVSRTGWVPLNRIIQKGQVIASDPELKAFGMANLQLAEHWARAMNPTGVMRESDRDKALGFLDTADSKETYKRAVGQLRTQIEREKTAVHAQKEPVPGGAAPSETGGTAAAAPAEAPKIRRYDAKGNPVP